MCLSLILCRDTELLDCLGCHIKNLFGCSLISTMWVEISDLTSFALVIYYLLYGLILVFKLVNLSISRILEWFIHFFWRFLKALSAYNSPDYLSVNNGHLIFVLFLFTGILSQSLNELFVYSILILQNMWD